VLSVLPAVAGPVDPGGERIGVPGVPTVCPAAAADGAAGGGAGAEGVVEGDRGLDEGVEVVMAVSAFDQEAYTAFLREKIAVAPRSGFDVAESSIHSRL
jgi:hypothetical protein